MHKVRMEYSKNSLTYTVLYESFVDDRRGTKVYYFKEEDYADPDEAYLEALKCFRTLQRRYCVD